MKTLIIIIFLFLSFSGYSQVRLYATAPDTLMLDANGVKAPVIFEYVRHSVFTATEGGTKSGIVRSFIYILTAASPLTNYTIEIPDIASDPDLLDNDIIEFMFEQSVTNLSYSNGTIIGGLATATVSSYMKMIYKASNDTWYAGGK